MQLIYTGKSQNHQGEKGPYPSITVYGSALGGRYWIHLSLLLASLCSGPNLLFWLSNHHFICYYKILKPKRKMSFEVR